MKNKKHDEDFFRTVYGDEELEKLKKLELSKQKENFSLDEGLDENIYPIKNNSKIENMGFRINEKDIENEFIRIAEMLLLQKGFRVNNIIARFTEIEFYYHCPNHEDKFTHVHHFEEGKWRFHNQGFDITLKGDEGYGGILIRGVNIENKYVNGPRRVLFELMKSLNSVNKTLNHFGLVDCDKLNEKIFRTFRHGLGESLGNSEFYKNAEYRFIITPQKFIKTQFNGAEQIARNFKDKELSDEFLGYTIKK